MDLGEACYTNVTENEFVSERIDKATQCRREGLIYNASEQKVDLRKRAC